MLYNKRMTNNIRTNVIVNIIRTVVLTFLSFITFPWVCRYLGDASVGIYTWCNTFVAYFLILAKIGIPNLAIRECVKVRDNKELLSNKVQAFFLIQSISTVLSFGLMTSLVFAVPELRESSSIVFLLSINFLSGAFSFEWVYIALEKQFYMSVRSIIVLTITAVLTIAFVNKPEDIYIYSLIAVSVTVLSSLANAIYIRKFVSFTKTMPYNLKQYVKPLVILCVLSIALSLYNQTDTFILGFLNEDKTQVASYSVGIKGIDVIIGIIAALSTVFIPRSAFYYQQEDKKYFKNLTKYSMNICLFIVLPAIVTMIIMAEPICGLIAGVDYSVADAAYDSAPKILMILAPIMLTFSLGDIIYGQVLLPMKKEKFYLLAVLGGTIVNVLLSLHLGINIYYQHHSVGVAIATTITDAAIIVVLFAITWKWTGKALFNKNTLKLLLANGVVAALTLVSHFVIMPLITTKMGSISSRYVVELISTVLVDAIAYIGVCILIKEDLVYSFIKNRKNKKVEENA